MFNILELIIITILLTLTYQNEQNVIIGIDLGTTTTKVGVFKNGRVEVIINDQGNRNTPSIVSFNTDGQFIVGELAKNQSTLYPTNTIYDSKRLIGRDFNDSFLQNDIDILPYKVLNQNGKPIIEIVVNGESKHFSPQQVSSMVLTKVKESVEAFLGIKVHKALISVPAYFNDQQREATKEAGKLAGLEVERLIMEPVSAAIAYKLEQEKGEKIVLVFHLGGSSCDASLLTIDDGVLYVSATKEEKYFGGKNFDERIFNFLLKEFKRISGKDCTTDKNAIRKLQKESERSKRILSHFNEVNIEIEEFFDGEDFRYRLSRDKFEELNQDLFSKIVHPIEQLLLNANISKSQIDDIILSGGSSNIPRIQQILQEFFNGKELLKSINPQEVVVIGTTAQARVLGEYNVEEPLFKGDILPLSIGIETVGGIMTNIVPRDTLIPTRKSLIFSTIQDNQTGVLIRIFEGEKELTKDNDCIGVLELKNIPAAPNGTPQIEISIEIDPNLNYHVQAKDLETGNIEKLEIKKVYPFTSNEKKEDKLINNCSLSNQNEELKQTSEMRIRLRNLGN